jgi:hypothetical protein
MRGAKRAAGDQRHAVAGAAGDAGEARGLDGLGEGHRPQVRWAKTLTVRHNPLNFWCPRMGFKLKYHCSARALLRNSDGRP